MSKDINHKSILLSSYSCAPFAGSESGNGWNWALSLAKNGLDVTLVTKLSNSELINKELAIRNLTTLSVVYIDLPDFIKYLARNQYLHYFFWQKYVYHYFKGRSYNFDIIHHVTWGSLHGGSQLWKLGKAFIFGPIGGAQTSPRAFRKYFGPSWKFELLRTAYTKILPYLPRVKNLVKCADLILCTNRETELLVNKMGAKKTEFFFDTGVSEDFLLPNLPNRNQSNILRILWTGGVYPRKALNLALDALKEVKIPFNLTILGDGPYARYIGKWIDHPNLVNKVTWYGWVSRDDVIKAYLEHDVFLFTSLRDSSPNQLMEAMATALPIITLRLHGSRDLVPEGAGILVPAVVPGSTIQGLANAVEKMYHDPKFRYSAGKIGFEFARNQTWSTRAQKMMNKYEEILEDCRIC